MAPYNFELRFSGICMFQFDEVNSGQCTVHLPTSRFPDAVFEELDLNEQPYPHFPRLVVPTSNLFQSRHPDQTRPDTESEELAIFHLEGDRFTLIVNDPAPSLQNASTLNQALAEVISIEEMITASGLQGAKFQTSRAATSLTFSIGDLKRDQLGRIGGKDVIYSFEGTPVLGQPAPHQRTMAEVVVLRIENLTDPIVFQSDHPLRPSIQIIAAGDERDATVRASLTNIHDRLNASRSQILDFHWYYTMFDFSNSISLDRRFIPAILNSSGNRTGSNGECPPTRMTTTASGTLLAPSAPIAAVTSQEAQGGIGAFLRRASTPPPPPLKTSKELRSSMADFDIRITPDAQEFLGTRIWTSMAREMLTARDFDVLVASIGGEFIPEDDDTEPGCVAVGNSNLFEATGVLYEEDIVLTAAHVVKNRYWSRIGFGTTFGGLRVVKGRGFEVHPGYQSEPQENDLAVILLRSKVTDIPVATLADPLEIDAAAAKGERLFVVGFGATRDVRPGQKNWIQPKIRNVIGNRLIAGDAGADSCNGDSGGPAYIETGDGRRLAAIASRSHDFFTTGSACGDGGSYCRIDRKTIDKMIANLRMRH